MTKKPTGLAAFNRAKPAAQVQAEAPATAPENETSADTPALRRKRGGGETVALTVKVRRSDWQRLRQLADAEGTSIQAIAEAGFSAVLAQHGLGPIEPHTR